MLLQRIGRRRRTVFLDELGRVLGAVAEGDLSQRMSSWAARDGDAQRADLSKSVNCLLVRLSVFADEVNRVAKEVGTEGRLGGRAHVPGVSGVWRDLTDSVNLMADNLTTQVRNIAQVATAVARGDLSQKITVDARGEILELKSTINTMVDQLTAFAGEVTRVAREVGTEGILGGQADVRGVSGTWQRLTDSVNSMAGNLTNQVRNIAQVTTAVAQGDLSKKIDVGARGEILELKSTINTMVDQLTAFAEEVTRVAREVGTEGILGGQADVEGVSGTWRRLTESVNRLACNLTTQVRAISTVATAVTSGDLTQHITVNASGEVAELKDNLNWMITNLDETTKANREQDWLKTSLGRISALMQGHRDLTTMASELLSELVPLVCAQQGAFFVAKTQPDGAAVLERVAGYGMPCPDSLSRTFRLRESLVGQAAADTKSIMVTDVPPGYSTVSSGLGQTAPANVIVFPLVFEGKSVGVIELGSLHEFTDAHCELLEQLTVTIGVNVHTILASSHTEALLSESQRLAQELRARSEELMAQQAELRRSNAELVEKATLLENQKRDIEIKNIEIEDIEAKNAEIEKARSEVEQQARQLTLASNYKSEFMANMSHELRTPMNTALILANLLADNAEGNLTAEQVEFARTICSAGKDLLQLIDDLLDLAKVEAGRTELCPDAVRLDELVGYVETLCRPLATQKGLDFSVDVTPTVPTVFTTDQHRVRQILRNLLSNAVKFTGQGCVRMEIRLADVSEVEPDSPLRDADRCIAFAVHDTGIGIPADQIPSIFEAFHQVDGTAGRPYGGTGLGLNVSKKLTELLGGALQVASEPGHGSTFTLYLPLTGPSGIDAPSEQESAPDGSASSGTAEQESPTSRTFAGQKVLIVDDDQRSLLAMTSLLERKGLTAIRADSATAGMEALTQHGDIALVLMDVMMPGLDGNTAIGEIRKNPRHANLPIIAVTAKAMRGDREESLQAGATDYLAKPVHPGRLISLIATYLQPAVPAETRR